MTKQALVVGIDKYEHPFQPLNGCIKDAMGLVKVLENNQDGSSNFVCERLYHDVTRTRLKDAIQNFFKEPHDISLFYFSGHGSTTEFGEFLIPKGAKHEEDGIPLRYLVEQANESKSDNVIIILDCCYSGGIINIQASSRAGLSILTASRGDQRAVEKRTGNITEGVFTKFLLDGLEGGAADVLGNVTLLSIYAYVEQAFGRTKQRPLLKTNLERSFLLRKCNPTIEISTLKKLPEYFSTPTHEYPLDKSYEPTEAPKNEKNEKIFKHFQKLRDGRLLVPVGEEHLYYAAINKKSCKLTALGQYYWQLAKDNNLS